MLLKRNHCVAENESLQDKGGQSYGDVNAFGLLLASVVDRSCALFGGSPIKQFEAKKENGEV